MVLAAAVLLPCSFATVSRAATATVLESMPIQDAAQEQAWNAELVKSGSRGVMATCDLIVPPGTGDDTKARYAIGSLTNYASRPGADQERSMVAGVLAKALVKSSDKEVKFFFINQLQFVGGDESVSVLAKYLDDERLCDAASGALMVIGTEAAEKAFLKALPGDRIAYAHIAGHYVEAEDIRVDTHGADVIDPVWKLLDVAYEHFGVFPTLLERDFNIPPLETLLKEVEPPPTGK